MSFRLKRARFAQLEQALSAALALLVIGSVSLIGANLLQDSHAAPKQIDVPAGTPGLPEPTTGAYWGGNNGTVAADPLPAPGCTGDAYAMFECKVDYFAAQQSITMPKQSDGKYHASMEHLYLQCSTAESKLNQGGYVWNQANVPGRKALLINFKCGSWTTLANSGGTSGADDQIKRIAALLVKLPVPVIVSFDAEPEDNSCDPPAGHGTDGTPDDYRAAYRQFTADMRNQQASMGKSRISFALVLMGETYRINSTHVFNGSCAGEVRNSPTGSMRNPENWWPGDDVVDWIGTDPYDFMGKLKFDDLMNWTMNFADKTCPADHPTVNYSCKTAERNAIPVLIAEYATCNQPGPYRGTWLDNHKAKLRSYPKVKAYAYWSEAVDNKCWVDYPLDDGSRTSIKAFARLSSDTWLTNPTFDDAPPDTTKPTVAITAPPNGTSIEAGILTTISANASDDVGVTKVEFYVDDVLKGSQPNPPFSYNWDTTAVTLGDHVLTAKAYDAAGNKATSAPITVTITNPQGQDVTPPTVTITGPPDGSTATGTITITGTAHDDTHVKAVTLRVDDVYQQTDNTAPYSFNLDTTKYTDGPHTIVLRAFDDADNMGQSQPITIMVDNAAYKVGDINKDGHVNIIDLSILLAHDGQAYAPADLNKDGIVNYADRAILLGNWTW